ncbi:MAG: tetratricopeptide repeat protein [Bacilli bacterium]
MKKTEKDYINSLVKNIENKEINLEKCVKELDDLCENKNRYAIYKKALLILKGTSYKYDLEKAINLLTLASFLNVQEASFQLGLIFFNKGKFVLAERYFLKASRIVESYFYLGIIEEKGKGKVKSLHRAFQYYLKGAKLNEYECSYKVGVFYLRGLGIKKNEEKGRKYLHIALKNKVEDYENLYDMFLRKKSLVK